MNKKKGKSITFRPSREHRIRLEKLAKAIDRPITWLIAKALEAHLAQLESQYAKELRALDEDKDPPARDNSAKEFH